MNHSVNSIFDMDYFKMLEHSKLIKFDEQIKDTTMKDTTKLNSLETNSTFQNGLFVNYACLLKMYLLDKGKHDKNNVQLIIEYFDFIEQEIVLFSTSIIIFAHYFFSGNSSIRKLIHKSKNVT